MESDKIENGRVGMGATRLGVTNSCKVDLCLNISGLQLM